MRMGRSYIGYSETIKIVLGALEIDLTKKNIKNLHLRVYPPNGRVKITAPLRMDDEAIRRFVMQKLDWIKKQQTKFQTQGLQVDHEFISGESHFVNGKRYLLNVIYAKVKPKVELRNETYLDLYVRVGSTKEQREKVLVEWYRRQLKEQIPGLLETWQRVIGVEIRSWGVKRMKTRWGTCNIAAQRIWLNLELAKKPKQCLEYIIVHELVHLLERHHNARFKTYMDEFMPEWRAIKEDIAIDL